MGFVLEGRQSEWKVVFVLRPLCFGGGTNARSVP